VRGEQSEKLLELRTMCLDDSLRAMRGLTQALLRADAALVEGAPRSVRALADLSACRDARSLLGAAPLPSEPDARTRVAELRGRLADVAALREAGRAGEGLALAGELARAATELGYRPLEAETLFELGRIEEESGQAAARTFERAVWAAEAGRHDRLAARAWIRLMSVMGRDRERRAEALDLRPRVTAIVERMTGDDELEGMLHLTTSILLREIGRAAEAEEDARRALASLERRFGPDDPRVADALEQLGVALGLEDKRGEARAALERSMAILERLLGPEHPDVGKVASSLAAVQ
jgi:hypothetical protein